MKLTAFLAVGAVALCTASSASAANVVPNPGFEAGGAEPTSWTQGSGTAIRDTVNPHSGAASYKLTPPADAGGNQATGASACTNASIGAGTRSASYWYRANAGITGVAMIVNLYANPGCTGGLGQTLLQPATVNTSGAWQLVSGSVSVPSAAQSFRVTLSTGCLSCNGTISTNFDDVSLQDAPTVAAVADFRAARLGQGVRLNWLATAPDAAGFNLYRGQTRLNRTLIIGARHAVGSGTLTWVDRTAGNGRALVYRLQVVRLDGTRAWVGTVTVRSRS